MKSRAIRPRSRNNRGFQANYPPIVQALGAMPDETVIDGEIVALDPAGRPGHPMSITFST